MRENKTIPAGLVDRQLTIFCRAGTAIGDMRNNMRIPNLLQKKQEEDQE